METHYAGCRRMVDVDCSQHIHIIIFLENIPHEIASSPCLSLYLSPIKKFDTKKICKNPITSQPIEYKGLSMHDSDLLGICYEMGGAEWPSHKKLYQSYHQRAYAHYQPRTREEYLQGQQGDESRSLAAATWRRRKLTWPAVVQITNRAADGNVSWTSCGWRTR